MYKFMNKYQYSLFLGTRKVGSVTKQMYLKKKKRIVKNCSQMSDFRF